MSDVLRQSDELGGSQPSSPDSGPEPGLPPPPARDPALIQRVRQRRLARSQGLLKAPPIRLPPRALKVTGYNPQAEAMESAFSWLKGFGDSVLGRRDPEAWPSNAVWQDQDGNLRDENDSIVVPPKMPDTEIMGRRFADELLRVDPQDPLVALTSAFPPGAVVSGGVSAAMREARPAFRAMRASARVVATGADLASASVFPRSSLALGLKTLPKGAELARLNKTGIRMAGENYIWANRLARKAESLTGAGLPENAPRIAEPYRAPFEVPLGEADPRVKAIYLKEAQAAARAAAEAAPPPDFTLPPLGGGASGAALEVPSNTRLLGRMNLHADDIWARAARKAGQLRVRGVQVLRPAIDRLNARALAEGPAQEGILVHAAVQDYGDNVAGALSQEMHVLGDWRKAFGLKRVVDAASGERMVLASRVKPKAPDASLAIADIIELGENAYDFTPQQRAMVNRARQAVTDLNTIVKAEGIKLDEITFLEPGRQYFPRWVTAISKQALKHGFGGTLQGSKQSFQKTRYYDLAIEGMRNGVDYADPSQALQTHARAVYKAIAEKRLHDILKPYAASAESLVSVAYKQPVADARVSLIRLAKAQWAIERRVAQGLNVTQPTLNSIRQSYPALAHALENATAQDAKQLRAALKQLQGQAQGNLRTAKRALDAEIEGWRSVASLGDKGIEKYGLQHIQGRAFGKENIFPIGLAKPVNAAIQDQGNQWLRVMNQVVTNTLMPLQAGMDFSAPLIQGLPALVTHPSRWATATAYHYRAFFDPAAAGKYFAAHPGLLDELVQNNVTLSAPEFYESGLLQKTPGLKQATDAFARSFESFGDILRGELWLANKTAAGKYGDGMARLSDFVNKSTGTLSTRGLGITPTQRELERSLIFFAPRYTRAYIGLMADIARGGYAGAAARDALGHLAAVGVGFTTLTALAKARNEDGFDADKFWEEWTGMLNPTSNHFLSLQFGGGNYGVGGVVYGTLKHAGRAIAIEAENPGAIFDFDPNDDERNPLSEGVAFWRGRISPIGGLAWDLISGYNYIGESTRGWGNLGRLAADQVLPFAVSARLVEQPGSGWATYPLDVTGFRVSPRSPWSMANDARDALAQERYGRRWAAEGKDGLTSEQRRAINNDSEVQERVKWAESVTNEREGDPAGIYQRLDAYQRRQGDLLDARSQDIAAAEADLRTGKIARPKLRERYQGIYDRFRQDWDRLGPSPAESLRNQREPHPMDLAAQRYFEALDVRQFTNRFGEVDWDAYDAAKARAQRGLAPAERAYVERQRLALKTPLEREYDAAKQRRRSYDEAWKRVVPTANQPEFRDYQKLQDTNVEAARAMARRKPWLLESERRIGRAREFLRRTDPQLERALVQWYGYTPLKERR